MSREDEAKRDLARMEREREKLFHISPVAANDDNDPAVKLGKKIARLLGPALLIAMLVYVLATHLT